MARAWMRPDTRQWYVLHGGKGKTLVGPDKKAAEYLANKINVEDAQRRAGLIPKENPALLKKPQIERLDEFWNYYSQWSAQNHRPGSQKRYRSIIRNLQIFLREHFAQISRLDQLEPFVFEKYKMYRKDTPVAKNGYPLSPQIAKKLTKAGRPPRPARDTTVNVELAIFRAIFNQAVDKGFLVINPTKGVQELEIRQEAPKRILSKDEAEKFLKDVRKVDAGDYDMYSLLLHTGTRIGELQHIHESNVDLAKRVIHIRPFEFLNPITGQKTWWSAKSKRDRGRRDVPIDDVAFEILSRRLKDAKNRKDPFVFGPYIDTNKFEKRARNRLKRHMKAIGIEDIKGPHNLRHTFISWLAMAGMPKESIMDIVGHVEDDTFEIYRHTTPEHRAGLLDALDLDL